MNPDYKRGYSKGYFAGSKGAWPDHRPPEPPHALFAGIMRAAQDLRDAIDAEISTFGEDDEVTRRIGPYIDAFDGQQEFLSGWLREEPAPTGHPR